jgi:hypothetical protein
MVRWKSKETEIYSGFPLTVFVVNLLLKYVVNIYQYWERADLPIHVIGGFSIAYFISGTYNLLPHETAKRHRTILLELILMGSLTASMAVFWEFCEFVMDLIFHTSVQESLSNTMLDLVMGMVGAVLMMLVRAWQLKVGIKDIKALTAEMSG